jgi:hypothetical protein
MAFSVLIEEKDSVQIITLRDEVIAQKQRYIHSVLYSMLSLLLKKIRE